MTKNVHILIFIGIIIILSNAEELSQSPDINGCSNSPDNEETSHHGISIVSWNFQMVKTPLVLVIWVLLAVFVKVIYLLAILLLLQVPLVIWYKGPASYI